MVICIQQVLIECSELLEPGVRNCISKGPVTFSCLLSMQCQSSLQLILAYILPWLALCISIYSAPPSLSTLLNGCPLYRSPICYAKKFLFLLSFVVFQLVSILYQGFWRTPFYCLQTSGFDCVIYFFLHISLGFQLQFSFWGILLLFADLGLLLFCLSF